MKSTLKQKTGGRQKMADFSEESEIFNLLAGTMDYFISDMEEIQKSSEDKEQYEKYLTNAKGMKSNLLQISQKLKGI
jgi:hypothetical protein